MIEKGVLEENNEYNKDFEDDIEIEHIRGNKIIKYKKKLLDKYFQQGSEQGSLSI